MKMIPLKCPSCGANLEIENGIDVFFCKYCGYKIILDGQSKESVKAKVRIKQMEHEENIKDKEFAHERFKIEKSENAKRFSLLQMVVFIPIMIIVFLIAFLPPYIKSVQQEKNLQKIVVEIEVDIADGDFDSALIKANSLYYDANWSDEIQKKWDNIRHTLITTIENKTKSKAPEAAKNLRGRNYREVVSTLYAAGFTNISTDKLEDLVNGWVTKDGDVEEVSIGGVSNFKSGDSFSKDSKIIITYHTFPQKK